MHCPWYLGGIPENRHDFQSLHSALARECRDLANPLTHMLLQTSGAISLVDNGVTWRPRTGHLAVVGTWVPAEELGGLYVLKMRGVQEDDFCGR